MATSSRVITLLRDPFVYRKRRHFMRLRELAAEALESQAKRIAELEARLELTTQDGMRLGIGDCDGIGCRDETIRLLDARVAKLEAQIAELIRSK